MRFSSSDSFQFERFSRCSGNGPGIGPAAATVAAALLVLAGLPVPAGAQQPEAFADEARYAFLRSTEAGTLLATERGRIRLGEPGDHFSSLLVLSDTRTLVAGVRQEEDGQRIVLQAVGTERSEAPARLVTLAGPVAAGHGDQTSPRLLAPSLAAGSPTLAWFEGTGQFEREIWTAELTADGASRPVRVAPRAAGSQVSLRGTRLADGRQILVWAAYDGEDHEILWSSREGLEWSSPQRVHPDNRVPDSSPTVVADGNGALLVWERLEGDSYRLVVSRLETGDWSEPRLLEVGAALHPRFVEGAPSPTLSFHRSRDRTWSFVRLGEHGAVEGWIVVPDAGLAERPEVASVAPSGLDVLTVSPSAGATDPSLRRHDSAVTLVPTTHTWQPVP